SPFPSNESQRKACFDATSKPTRETRALPKQLDRETLAAGTVSRRVGIGDFEAALLQVFAVIEHGAANEKRALRIDDKAHVLGRHKNVPLLRTVHQVHHILQAGAAAADHLEAQGTVRLAFFFKQRR